MAFKPVVRKVTVEDEDESVDIFVRQPSGREMLDIAGTFKKDTPATQVARDIFTRFVVHEDGTPLNKDEVNEMMEWRFAAMNKASGLVQEKIGLRPKEDDEAKKV